VISVLKDMIKLKDITGFVTCMYDNFWWLGCVLSVSKESNNVKINFLHYKILSTFILIETVKFQTHISDDIIMYLNEIIQF
jgi:hypothetical protein